MRKLLNFYIIKLSDYFFGYDGEKIAQEFEKIYSQRKGSDSPGGFGCERTGETNFGTLQKNL